MCPDVFRGPWGGSHCRDSPVQTIRECSCTQGTKTCAHVALCTNATRNYSVMDFFLSCLQVAQHLQMVIFCGVINHFQELLSIPGHQFRVNLEINDLLSVCNMDKLLFRISVINKAVHFSLRPLLL